MVDCETEESIRIVLDFHEAYTVITYTDTEERVKYQCRCGKTEMDGLSGRDWLVHHLTEEVVKIL